MVIIRDLLKFISCIWSLCFCGTEEIQASNQEDLKKRSIPEAGTISVSLLIPSIPGLCLISKSGFRYFELPKGKSVTEILNILAGQGFSEITYPQASLPFEEEFHNEDWREKMMNDPTADILPQAVKSAIELFLTDCRSGIPEDEQVLFFLHSLLRLKKPCDTELKNSIADKLSNYNSYYKPDPYKVASRRLHDVGIFEYKKFFAEENFKDLVLVLEFSKLMKNHNKACARDFEVFSDVLKVIVETFVENESNSVLLQKFKELYERVVRG